MKKSHDEMKSLTINDEFQQEDALEATPTKTVTFKASENETTSRDKSSRHNFLLAIASAAIVFVFNLVLDGMRHTNSQSVYVRRSTSAASEHELDMRELRLINEYMEKNEYSQPLPWDEDHAQLNVRVSQEESAPLLLLKISVV